MTETVSSPKAGYVRLHALEEDFADAQAALAIQAKIAGGEKELIPAVVVDRLLTGEAPLRVWREHRHYTKVGIAKASGVNRVQIVEIEAGRSTGSVHTLSRLVSTLGVEERSRGPALVLEIMILTCVHRRTASSGVYFIVERRARYAAPAQRRLRPDEPASAET